MSVLPATGNVAGQIEPITGEEYEMAQNNCDNTTAFVRGDVVFWGQDGTIYKGTAGAAGKFGVCVKAKAQTATYAWIYDKPGGKVSVVADGAIKAGQGVKCSTGTDGRVEAWNPSSGTSADAEDTLIGWYEKRYQYVSEGDGSLAPADAAQGNVILIKLRGS